MFPWSESYFLCGLDELFGSESVTFDIKEFFTLADDNNRRNTFNFIVEHNGNRLKCSIDWFDLNTINNQAAYDWCDVYCKVNTNWKITPIEVYPKIVPVGPTMGIHYFSNASAIKYYFSSMRQYVRFSDRINYVVLRDYARSYYRERKRARLDSYKPNTVEDDNYLFFLSTLWYNADWNDNDNNLNTPRYNIIKTLKSFDWLNFEGGFIPHQKRSNRRGYVSSTEKYKDAIYCGDRLSIFKYIDKIQHSFAVINTPAVAHCFGWKLAEYLAMGKAIISLPLVNDLPYPLEHGENIHFIDGSTNSLESALQKLSTDKEYRFKLSKGARAYWERYCAPVKVIETATKSLLF